MFLFVTYSVSTTSLGIIPFLQCNCHVILRTFIVTMRQSFVAMTFCCICKMETCSSKQRKRGGGREGGREKDYKN